MAIIYVDSTAGGVADGTSWTDAYVTLQAGLTAWTTADIIWVAHDSTESFTANTTFTCGNATKTDPVTIFRVNSGTSIYSPTTGADVKTLDSSTGNYDFVFGFNMAMYGLHMDTGDDWYNITNDTYTYIEDCYLEFSSTGNASFQVWQNSNRVGGSAKNCTFEWNTTGYIDHAGGKFDYFGCTFSGANNSAGLFICGSNQPTNITLTDCDMSGLNNPTLVDTSTFIGAVAQVTFLNCKFPTSYSLDDGTIANRGVEIVANGCHTAGDTFVNDKANMTGDVSTSTSVYHDSGYTDYDGTTQLSQVLTASADCKPALPLEGFKIGGIVTSTGSTTFTVELVENFTSALTANDAWLELYYYDSATSVTHKLDNSSREHALTSYTNLSAGTGLANWTGEPASSRSVKIAVTVTVNQTGLYYGVINLSKYEAAKVLHVDPKMSVA